MVSAPRSPRLLFVSLSKASRRLLAANFPFLFFLFLFSFLLQLTHTAGHGAHGQVACDGWQQPKEDAWRASVGWEWSNTRDLVRKRTRDPATLSWPGTRPWTRLAGACLRNSRSGPSPTWYGPNRAWERVWWSESGEDLSPEFF